MELRKFGKESLFMDAEEDSSPRQGRWGTHSGASILAPKGIAKAEHIVVHHKFQGGNDSSDGNTKGVGIGATSY